MVIAQDWLKNNFNDRASDRDISLINTSGGTNNNPASIAHDCDELTGELVIDGYINTKVIHLQRHEATAGNLIEGGITKLTIKNCPKLEKLDVDWNKLKEINFEGPFPNLKWLDVRRNKLLKEIEVGKLPNLEELFLIDNELITLEGLKGLEKLTRLKNIDFSGINHNNGLNFSSLKELKDAIRNLLGITGDLPSNWHNDLTSKLGGKNLKDIPAGQTLASLIAHFSTDVANLQSQLNQAISERDAANSNLDEIKSELGLGSDADQQQIIDKIKELQGRPTHDDHEGVISHRDILQAENNRLKNKGKENKDTISKSVLVNGAKKWGITLSNKQDEKIQNASSANEVETARNEIIKDEFDRLKDENNSSTRLNIGLGVLAIGSLLILGWVLLRQSNLPTTEPEEKKIK